MPKQLTDPRRCPRKHRLSSDHHSILPVAVVVDSTCPAVAHRRADHTDPGAVHTAPVAVHTVQGLAHMDSAMRRSNRWVEELAHRRSRALEDRRVGQARDCRCCSAPGAVIAGTPAVGPD